MTATDTQTNLFVLLCGRVCYLILAARNSQLTIGAFANRLSKKIGAISEGQMNNPSFVGAHWLERKSHPGLSYSVCGEVCHCLQLRFTSCAKAMHITNKPRAAGETSSKDLVD